MSIKKKRTISDIIDAYFEDLERWAEQFEETMMQRPSWNLKNCTIEPLREIMVTPTEVVVTVDLPYTEKKLIRVKPVGHTSLEISAKMKRKIRLDDLGVTYCKGEFERFYCHVRIPVPVNMDDMNVSVKKGILEIRLRRKY
jgi:HSP20 family molecular chaperone IbpA